MKALILAGGSGTRLRPITHTSAKQLVPVANKPIVHYVLEEIASAGILDVGIVVGDARDDIVAALGDGSRWGLRISYVDQPEPLGLAHAVAVAGDYLGDDDFVMYLGDNLLEQPLRDLVERFARERGTDRGPTAQIQLARVENPTQFGVVELGQDGQVIRLHEKPASPPSNLALVGVYLFDRTIHDAVRAIEPSARGEYEITDAIQWLIDHGHVVTHEILTGWWIDTGKRDDLLESNRLILETLEPVDHGSVDDASSVEGRVVIEKDATLVGSRVVGPAIIGERTRLIRSTVGPFASIAADCEIEDSHIEGSMMLERSRVRGVVHLVDSLLGRDVEVQGNGREHRTRLALGDHSHVELT